eukprot:765014-Hanusia_phi.AAC.1
MNTPLRSVRTDGILGRDQQKNKTGRQERMKRGQDGLEGASEREEEEKENGAKEANFHSSDLAVV